MSVIFDPDEVLEQIGGDEDLLVEIIKIFIDTYPEDLKILLDSINEGDPESIRKNAHRMKGSVSNFGKRQAFESAKLIENLAKEGDLSKMPSMYDDLAESLFSLEREVKQYHDERV